MANISTLINAVKTAQQGADVRDAIADTLTAVNVDNVAITSLLGGLNPTEIAAAATTATTKAGEAAASATDAMDSEVAAGTAKTAAQTAKTAAELAETHAETAEINAKASETASKASETAAAGSAATATTKANESAASAAAALASEQAAALRKAETQAIKDAAVLALSETTDEAEVIEARKGKGSLGEKINEIDSQLAETEQEVYQNKINESLENTLYSKPLAIWTFDNMNEPYHPSVYYNNSKWNGFKYWMAFTPYSNSTVSPYTDRWECPCIVVSDDGVDFKPCPGAPNPLVDLTADEITRHDYFSDPCIVMSGSTMEIWYRKTDGSNATKTDIYRVKSTDGINWTSPEMVLDSQRIDNGFGLNETMRSQQLFFDGTMYTAFFSWMGSTGIGVSTTTDPSSGVWTVPQRLVFANAPQNMSIWHLGMCKDGNVYHMIGYDSINNALQYFTSTNGVDFDFVKTVLRGGAELSSIKTLYQSVPLKIDGNWALYVGATYKKPFNTFKNGISTYIGSDLQNLKPANSRRYTMESIPTLVNNSKDTGNAPLYYSTLADYFANKFNGYGMGFGSGANFPTWYDSFKHRPITFVFDDVVNPTIVPPSAGIIWRNINTKRVFLSVGTSVVGDWREINLLRSRINVAAAATISVDGAGLVVINSGVSTSITNFTSGVEGQEITILNTLSAPMTIVNNAGGTGGVRLRGAANLVLNLYDSVTLFLVSTSWYQK